MKNILTGRKLFKMFATVALAGALLPAAFADKADLDEGAIIRDIERLAIEYAYAIDAADFEKVAELFAEDGVWELLGRRLEGRDAMVEFVQGWAQRNRQGISSRMAVDNHLIDIVDNNHATGRAYLTLYSFKSAPALNDSLAPVFFTIAEDEYVRTPEGWRFQTRRIIDSAKIAPTPE